MVVTKRYDKKKKQQKGGQVFWLTVCGVRPVMAGKVSAGVRRCSHGIQVREQREMDAGVLLPSPFYSGQNSSP